MVGSRESKIDEWIIVALDGLKKCSSGQRRPREKRVDGVSTMDDSRIPLRGGHIPVYLRRGYPIQARAVHECLALEETGNGGLVETAFSASVGSVT